MERVLHQEGFISEIYEFGDGPTEAPVDPQARLISWWFSAPLQHDITSLLGSERSGEAESKERRSPREVGALNPDSLRS